ncbi:PEP-CTERM sorting domain-containing protein [Marinobacter zhanjiangensis]|uniref:Ice-binding protein C-terminal domain-containing protein n=1 Tax=Marinobacter zhanjiangensis TaxID=578215 RepID=A0ABQ3AZK4_9GAMM|nr:PEP-CTERM sorting domain-containing protein [Marinobacter zhanjiangensis]GGY72715.1 hypothetical protein GCM10007071_19750 [Marinobacter zhanjiangensis]
MRIHRNKATALISGSILMAASMAVQAAPVACINGGVNDTYSASANGAYADACHYFASNIADSSVITAHTNGLWGSPGNDFTYVGKDSEAGEISGIELMVSGSDDEFKYLYQLIVPQAWEGTTVDWVLGVKQASNSYTSYLFEDVTLGIDGGFNSFWLNPQGKEGNDFSFAAGFIRVVDVPVPEPGSLALLGLGLIGLRFARQHSKSA